MENILFSLALETGTVNSQSIIVCWSNLCLLALQRFYTMWLDTKYTSERKALCIFYLFLPLFQKIGNRYFHPSIFLIRNCSHIEKLYLLHILYRLINYFTFNVFLFFFLQVKEWKRMIQSYVCVKCLDINVTKKIFWKNS